MKTIFVLGRQSLTFITVTLLATPQFFVAAEGCGQRPSNTWFSGCRYVGESCVVVRHWYPQGCESAPSGNGCYWRDFAEPRTAPFSYYQNGMCWEYDGLWYCVGGYWIQSNVTYLGEYYWNQCWIT